jgi:integrase
MYGRRETMAKGHIQQRGKSWRVIVYLGKDANGKKLYKRETVRGSKKDAQKRLTELEHMLDRGLPITTSKEKVRDFMERWLADHVAHTTRPRTLQFYQMINRLYIEPTIGHINLEKLTPADITRVVANVLGKGLSPTTARRTYATLHRALECALKWGLVYRNVCDAIDAPREAENEVNPPDKQTVQNLLEAARETPYGAAYWLLAYSGARRGEICAIRREHLDMEKGTLSITGAVARIDGRLTIQPPKSATSRRMIHLGEATVAVLRAHLAKQAEERLRLGSLYEDNGLLFASPMGKLLDPDLLSKNWIRLCKQAGVKYRLHDLRHAHATTLIESGVHIKAVQTRLGHSSPSLTMKVYSHVSPQMDDAAADAFEAAMGN